MNLSFLSSCPPPRWSYWVKCAMEIAHRHPASLYTHLEPFIDTSFLNVKNVFGSDPDSVDDVKKLVWATFELMSETLH